MHSTTNKYLTEIPLDLVDLDHLQGDHLDPIQCDDEDVDEDEDEDEDVTT